MAATCFNCKRPATVDSVCPCTMRKDKYSKKLKKYHVEYEDEDEDYSHDEEIEREEEVSKARHAERNEM